MDRGEMKGRGRGKWKRRGEGRLLGREGERVKVDCGQKRDNSEGERGEGRKGRG